ncbi:hypothetical protein GQ457_03G012970 [Hibiscus cannabinus]
MDEFVSHVINSEKNDGVGVAYAGSNSGDMVVPNSFRAPNTWKINHIWEDNIREDLCVVEPRFEAQECMPEENVRLTVWVGDKYMEPYLVASVQEIDIVVLKPSEAIPRNRSEMAATSKVELITHHGGSRKVKSMSKIALNFMALEERIETSDKLRKNGRGRPHKYPPKAQEIVNGSLTYSDFVKSKQIILREVRETMEFGKLICMKTIGNEENVV